MIVFAISFRDFKKSLEAKDFKREFLDGEQYQGIDLIHYFAQSDLYELVATTCLNQLFDAGVQTFIDTTTKRKSTLASLNLPRKN